MSLNISRGCSVAPFGPGAVRRARYGPSRRKARLRFRASRSRDAGIVAASVTSVRADGRHLDRRRQHRAHRRHPGKPALPRQLHARRRQQQPCPEHPLRQRQLQVRARQRTWSSAAAGSPAPGAKPPTSVSGIITGRMVGNRISAVAQGDSFNADLAVTTTGNRMIGDHDAEGDLRHQRADGVQPAAAADFVMPRRGPGRQGFAEPRAVPGVDCLSHRKSETTDDLYDA